MKCHENLSAFNRRMADELRSTFAPSVKPYQAEDSTLLFRGPIPNQADPNHVGTHVAVSLEEEVRAALDAASPAEQEEMIEALLSNLGTQVRVWYNAEGIGPYALDIVGTMRTLRG